ncbi:MAG: hypothetical protein JWQ10_3792, partial [Herbaspirillum sp.]|nr:hypothetical protein [Herbaspirillum sp.]
SRKRPYRLGEGHGGLIEEAITVLKFRVTERHYRPWRSVSVALSDLHQLRSIEKLLILSRAMQGGG